MVTGGGNHCCPGYAGSRQYSPRISLQPDPVFLNFDSQSLISEFSVPSYRTGAAQQQGQEQEETLARIIDGTGETNCR